MTLVYLLLVAVTAGLWWVVREVLSAVPHSPIQDEPLPFEWEPPDQGKWELPPDLTYTKRD